MRLVAWNIQGGGGKRIASIADELIGRDADVVVISEYVCGRTEALVERLTQAGWIYHVLPVPPERYGGVAIVSRLEMRRVEDVGDLGPQAHYRHAAVEFPSEGIELRGLYAPLHDDPFDAFWDGLQSSLASARNRSVLVVGDFNSGSPLVDTPGHTLFCSKHFERLPDAGYLDLWRQTHGSDAREYTWECRNNGSTFPFRLDHAFGTTTLANRLISCEYDHSVRHPRLSDHSMMIMEFTSELMGV